jgi:ubiquinone/menaquinone biosynthesis C-methylase UbiE
MTNAHAHNALMEFIKPRSVLRHIGITPGKVVADFGAGSGAYVLAIAEYLKGSGRIYAVDIQKDLLSRLGNEAKRSNLEINLLWGDLEKPQGSSLGDESVDVVLVSNILFQVDNKEAVLREARRIVRPRGHVAIIEWSDSFGGLGPTSNHVLRKENAQNIADAVGLSLIDEFPAGSHHYGLLYTPN